MREKLKEAFTDEQLNMMNQLGFIHDGCGIQDGYSLAIFWYNGKDDFDQVYRENGIYYYDMFVDSELVESKKFMTFDKLKEYVIDKTA